MGFWGFGGCINQEDRQGSWHTHVKAPLVLTASAVAVPKLAWWLSTAAVFLVVVCLLQMAVRGRN
jgi:hypothetical protein